MVFIYAGNNTIGRSAIDEPCDKNDGRFTIMPGSVFAVHAGSEKSDQMTGQVKVDII